MEKTRTYFVIDMKSFFASVECADRGLNPMTTNLVVADESRTDKTICLAVTPAMKKIGIKNRCRLFEIPKDLEYIIAPPRMKRYIDYASEIYGIYLKYISKTDIHVYSIDECFIDATDYLKIYNLSAKDFVKKLMKEIWDTLKVPSSAGIGTNMYLAKIALDITAKHAPDNIGVLDQNTFIKTLWNHKPITDFWGISTGTANRLSKYGIYDMQGITRLKEDVLYKEFGINAELLIDHANGIETCLMQDIKNYKGKSKSISQSQILPCNYNYDDALMVLKEMIQNGCYELAKLGFSTDHVGIIVSYGDSKGDSVKAVKRMNVTTNLFSIIGGVAENIYREIVDKNRPIRRLAYDFSGLVLESDERYDFFTDMNKIVKEKRLVSSILDVQQKFGKNSLLKAVDLTENATLKERNAQIGGHKSGEN